MNNMCDLDIIQQDITESIVFAPSAKLQDEAKQLVQKLWLCILAGTDDMKRRTAADLDEGEVTDLCSLLKGCNEIDDVTLKSFIDLLLSNIDLYLEDEDKQRLQTYTVNVADGIVTMTVTLDSGDSASSTFNTNGL